MKRLLVSLNINDYTCANVRDSLLHASERWDCEYIELTENLVGSQHLMFNKLVGIKKLIQTLNPDFIFYVDGDVLIRSDAPSPFELFGQDHAIYAVRDVYDTWTPHRLQVYKIDVTDPWLSMVHDFMRWDVNISTFIETSHHWFFNAGVFLINVATCKSYINIFTDHIPSVPVHHRIEQALWNYILKIKDGIGYMPYEWNLIDPNIEGEMTGYIYHFTGMTWNTLKPRLADYNWRRV